MIFFVGKSGFDVVIRNQTTSQDKPLQPAFPIATPVSRKLCLGVFPRLTTLLDCLHPHICIPAPLGDSAWLGVRPSDLLSGRTPSVRKTRCNVETGMHDDLLCGKLWFWRRDSESDYLAGRTLAAFFPHRNSRFKETLLACCPQADYLFGLPPSPISASQHL